MKKAFALLVFGCITGIYSTSLASSPPPSDQPVPLVNCAHLCPICFAQGDVCTRVNPNDANSCICGTL